MFNNVINGADVFIFLAVPILIYLGRLAMLEGKENKKNGFRW